MLAGIYLGTITSWNDPAITKINKGVTLPNEKIVPVFRCDASGDTYAFTNFLYHSSSDWKSKVGLGTAVQFPVGTGAKGNSGVAGVISSTEGAIGYVSTFYVRDNGLHEASVENLAGKFVYPYIQDITAAAALVKNVTPNAQISIVNPAWTKPKKGAKLTATEKLQQIAYPIATYTYVIVPSAAQAGGPAEAVPDVRDQPRRAEEGRAARVRAAAQAGGGRRDDDDQLPVAARGRTDECRDAAGTCRPRSRWAAGSRARGLTGGRPGHAPVSERRARPCCSATRRRRTDPAAVGGRVLGLGRCTSSRRPALVVDCSGTAVLRLEAERRWRGVDVAASTTAALTGRSRGPGRTRRSMAGRPAGGVAVARTVGSPASSGTASTSRPRSVCERTGLAM